MFLTIFLIYKIRERRRTIEGIIITTTITMMITGVLATDRLPIPGRSGMVTTGHRNEATTNTGRQ